MSMRAGGVPVHCPECRGHGHVRRYHAAITRRLPRITLTGAADMVCATCQGSGRVPMPGTTPERTESTDE